MWFQFFEKVLSYLIAIIQKTAQVHSSASSQVNRPGALPIEVENNPKSEVLFKINWICLAIFV